MKLFNIYLTLILLASLTFIGCSDDSPVNSGGEGSEASSKFVIAATPTALEDVADYLLTTESLTEGSVSTLNNGIEQDGTYRYYTTNDNKYFSLLYGQGNPGAVTSYQLNGSGNLQEITDFQTETVQAFAPVQDDILMIKVPRGGNDPTAHWYRLDSNTSQFIDEGQIDVEKLSGNDEWAHFNWITQAGDKVYIPYASIKACCNNNLGTEYPDSAWVAVYSYPEMTLENVIKDDRTSFIGRYFTKGLSVDEKGDIYAFSSSVANNNGTFTSSKPSAITRIQKGSNEFDQSYFFNIREASDGHYLTNHVYTKDGNVLLMMKKEKTLYTEGHKLAVINIYDKSFRWVNGLPETSSIKNITSMNNYVSKDGNKVYTGITTEESSFVYAVDIASATAKRGLEVKGGVITSINKLDPAE